MLVLFKSLFVLYLFLSCCRDLRFHVNELRKVTEYVNVHRSSISIQEEESKQAVEEDFPLNTQKQQNRNYFMFPGQLGPVRPACDGLWPQ